jgi:hypothetical protein
VAAAHLHMGDREQVCVWLLPTCTWVTESRWGEGGAGDREGGRHTASSGQYSSQHTLHRPGSPDTLTILNTSQAPHGPWVTHAPACTCMGYTQGSTLITLTPVTCDMCQPPTLSQRQYMLPTQHRALLVLHVLTTCSPPNFSPNQSLVGDAYFCVHVVDQEIYIISSLTCR